MSGFIRKRPNGKWQARFTPRNGKQRAKDFKQRKDADAWLIEQQISEKRGTTRNASDVRVGDLYCEWLTLKGLHVSEKTMEGYQSLWNSVVAPSWENCFVNEVNLTLVRHWLGQLDQKLKLSNSRITQAYQVLCMILDMAVEKELLAYNKARKPLGSKNNSLIPKAKAKREPVILTPEEIWKLAKAAGPHQTFILFMGMLGLRFGEAAALKPMDFSVREHPMDPSKEEHLVTIQRSISLVRGVAKEVPPKTGKSRTLVIPDVMWPLVAARLKVVATDQYVCSSQRNRVIRNQNFHREVWAPLKARLELPPQMTLHDLRHSAITVLVDNNHSVNATSSMAGHSSTHQTLDRYTHPTSETATRTAAKIDELYAFAGCDKVVTTSTVTKKSRNKLHQKSNVYIARNDAPVAQRGKSNGFLNRVRRFESCRGHE